MIEKKQVLAFGDSLTWGRDPEAKARHRHADRWTSVVEAELADVRVIAEGLSGRTTCFDDHAGPADRNGTRVLPVLISSHAPLDLVIIMLGTNDLKPHVCGSALGASFGMARLVEIVRTYPHGRQPPAILLMSPPHFGASRAPDGQPGGGRSIAESQKLAPLYKAVAERADCSFFDAASVSVASKVDGVHLDAVNTRAIGTALAPVVAAMLTR